MELALADVLARVVGVAEGDGDDDQDVEEEGGEQKSPEPVLVWARPELSRNVFRMGGIVAATDKATRTWIKTKKTYEVLIRSIPFLKTIAFHMSLIA